LIPQKYTCLSRTPHPVPDPNSNNAAVMAANAQLFANTDIVAANERVVLTEPLDPNCAANRHLDPTVQSEADALR